MIFNGYLMDFSGICYGISMDLLSGKHTKTIEYHRFS